VRTSGLLFFDIPEMSLLLIFITVVNALRRESFISVVVWMTHFLMPLYIDADLPLPRDQVPKRRWAVDFADLAEY